MTNTYRLLTTTNIVAAVISVATAIAYRETLAAGWLWAHVTALALVLVTLVVSGAVLSGERSRWAAKRRRQLRRNGGTDADLS